MATAERFIQMMNNALGLTDPRPAQASQFYGRPFRIIHGEIFAAALRAQITDPEVQRIATRPLIGSLDQFSDNTDLREAIDLRFVLRELYGNNS